ncbi:MAG: hypothetical protein AABY22_07715 [Nanoarchaeota archaeon]
MGSTIEINDTLKISRERGFPKGLTLEGHIKDTKFSLSYLGSVFAFWNKDERLYNRAPARVFLVEEIDGKWLYWGNALVISQTIEDEMTKGKYKIIKIYSPEFQRQMTIEESPEGKSYFEGSASSFVLGR